MLGSSMFETPVGGRGIVMGDSQGTPGFTLASRDVAPSLSPSVGILHEPRYASTAIPSPDALATEIANQMGDVLQQVSQKVVQNIMTQLSPSISAPLTNTATSPVNVDMSTSNVLGASHMQLVSHRKLKDPPCFKGDSSDFTSVREWEELMRDFIRKNNLRPEVL